MLERLEVHNLAVLEEVGLQFGPGLTVMTGETGAGKSVLVDALSLLLGERAEGMLRPGSEALLVTAWLGGRVVSRRVAGGRSTPRLEGEVVSLRELAEATSQHLSIHAQHAALSLTGRRAQRLLLDALLGGNTLSTYRQAYTHLQALEAERQQLEQTTRERERRLDTLAFQVQEITAAQLEVGQEARLQAEAERLRHLETLRERVGRAAGLLQGEGAATQQTAAAMRELRLAARHDTHLEALAPDLQAALDGLVAVARELEDYLETLEADPHRLGTIEDRLALIERLSRKYGSSEAEILAYAAAAQRELHQLQGADTRLAELLPQLEQARATLLELGTQLTQQRQQAAHQLAQQITHEVQALGMPNAQFSVSLSPLPAPGPDGLEEVQFLFSANPGLPPAPLEKAASGGELSRVMLALALYTGSEAHTVVFDEVDAGIGGEAAWAVADRLARLAQTRQVLVVTHLAQIAARAQQHFRVTKDQGTVAIQSVIGDDRVRELARMLSGSYSETALQHARELLQASS